MSPSVSSTGGDTPAGSLVARFPVWISVQPRQAATGDVMLNLFRKVGDLVPMCAVPDGAALPSFLRGRGWEFVGKVTGIADQLPEMDRATHEAVLRETGYYVFVPTEGARP